jgi:uncharacterized damage-inducible protein DinB
MDESPPNQEPISNTFPAGTPDERELLLRWLRYLRGGVVRKLDGVSDEDARWTPDGKLISLLGIVNHLTNAERRWIDGGMLNREVDRRTEAEFHPGSELTVDAAVAGYRARAAATDAAVDSMPLTAPCSREPHADLRWVLLHLINETARHAGHADATRELLDGTIGE